MKMNDVNCYVIPLSIIHQSTGSQFQKIIFILLEKFLRNMKT